MYVYISIYDVINVTSQCQAQRLALDPLAKIQ